MKQTHVSLSAAAAKRIAAVLKNNPGKNALRISVEGGGCSGFSYKYELTEQKNAHEDDFVIKQDTALIFIDSLSLPFLKGAEIDFVDNLMGQNFIIHNPNAIASCGCGASFSVA